MDFSNKATRDPTTILQKVKDKILLGKIILKDPNIVCFMQISAYFKTDKFFNLKDSHQWVILSLSMYSSYFP